MKGWEVVTLANSDSQTNTMMPNYVCQHEFPILPLEDLDDHPLSLSRRTRPLGFIILCVQVREIAGYDEDIVFLVMLDESDFLEGKFPR